RVAARAQQLDAAPGILRHARRRLREQDAQHATAPRVAVAARLLQQRERAPDVTRDALAMEVGAGELAAGARVAAITRGLEDRERAAVVARHAASLGIEGAELGAARLLSGVATR